MKKFSMRKLFQTLSQIFSPSHLKRILSGPKTQRQTQRVLCANFFTKNQLLFDPLNTDLNESLISLKPKVESYTRENPSNKTGLILYPQKRTNKLDAYLKSQYKNSKNIQFELGLETAETRGPKNNLSVRGNAPQAHDLFRILDNFQGNRIENERAKNREQDETSGNE